VRGRELQHNVACACGMRVGFSMFDVPDPLVVHVLLLTHEFMCRVGQNHIYTVYIQYFWQGNDQIYGHIRCMYTVLANPIYV